MSSAFEFRPIVHDDIDEVVAAVCDAFTRYRAFAPADWEPPSPADEDRRLKESIGDPSFWGGLVRDGEALVGHATFIPAARHSFRPEQDDSSAHLLHLFVKPDYWGSGIAAQLLSNATHAATRRGFTAMRLFVAAGQARARGFYEREGSVAAGEPFEFGFGLPTVEYRRDLEPESRRLG